MLTSHPISPCWSPANVEKAISRNATALLGDDHRPYFLATHAPVTQILEDRANKTIDEEVFFRRIMTGAGGDVMAVVHGDPGTGKSHLIHWLKLRTDDELGDRRLENLRTVLIQRSTGTLKDALTQMLQQLGGDFERHLLPVRQALEKIGDHAAREKLLLALSLELGPLRKDRGKPELPRSLRSLAEACKSEGFGTWLCRTGGAIDRNIRRLTEPRSLEGSEVPLEMAEFTQGDLRPSAEYRDQRHIAGSVLELLDELDDDEQLRLKAAAEMNGALRHAIQEVTGLGGNRLKQVFDDVRRELRTAGKELALFIEDVSAVGELDGEVINAVEPQQRPDLCRLIAVLGITEAGFKQLRDNIKQRLTHVYTVGSNQAGNWRDDQDNLARFAGRYLNAIRLKESEVRNLAEQRRTHRDIGYSACTDCKQREGCHRAFGKVMVGEVEVGLFPFTPEAPRRLLANLATDRPGIQQTPRGLLAHAMLPVLTEGGLEVDLGAVPPAYLPVERHSFRRWRDFIDEYCGGGLWTDEQKQRLQTVAEMWAGLPDGAEPAVIASSVLPLMPSLKFPKFSRSVKQIAPPTIPEKVPIRLPASRPPSDKLRKFLDRLQNWKEGKDFQKDDEPRQLLAGLIRKAIAWDENRVPLNVWKTLIGDGSIYQFVRIQGQISKPTTAFLLDFPRGEDTAAVLEALAQVEYGDTTWDPKYSPRHQRRISRWVRANEAMIIERLKAAGGRDTSVPTEAAVRFLAAAAMLRRRAKLPEKSHEVLREILLGPWKDEDKPVALSQKFQEVIDDMQRTYQQVRTFLLGEINVPQGLTGGINFIDPRPILRHAEAFGDDLKVGPISEEYFGSYWKSRFAPMQRINAFANLPDVLKFERESLASLLNEIRQLLEIDEGQSFDLANRIREYCIAVGAVKAAMRDTKTAARPDLVFDPLWLRKSYTESADTWGRAVQRCKEIVDTGSPLEILLFDPGKLKEAEHHLRAACNYVRNLNEDLDESESDWFKDQGQADTEAELMTLLTIIARADGTTVSDPSEIGASADSQNSDTEVSDDDGTDAE